MARAKNPQSVDWLEYFESIHTECPWSLLAYKKGLIDIVDWLPIKVIPTLGDYKARMYVIDYPNKVVEAVATELNSGDSACEWLYSYPGYGEFATPVSVLIQQDRQELANLRKYFKHDKYRIKQI